MGKTITFIRHGMTPGNKEKRYIGITDEPLSIEGEREITSRHYPDADIVFSSPLLRCLQTCEIIYPEIEPVIIDGLKETDFGDFEGKNHIELDGDRDYQDWIDSNGTLPFPNGESMQIAKDRAIKTFSQIIKESGDYSNITVITHGGTIMAILSHIFGGDYYSYHVENGEGYTFDLSFDGIYSGLHSRHFIR